jgi:peptide/nickel transport system substrate-binding protein
VVGSNGNGIREKNGVSLDFTIGAVGSETRTNTMAVAQQQLAQCGIKLETKTYTPQVFYTTYANKAPCSTGELDICESSRAADFPDPNISLFLSSQIPTNDLPAGLNVMRLSDPTLDKLFALQATQIDQTQRQQTFYQIGQYMTQNVYWLGIWNDPDLWAYNSRLSGVKFSGAEPFYNVNEWDIK